MNEEVKPPIEIAVGFGRINATWIDGTAIWMSDYYPRKEPDMEALQLATRETNLAHAFKKYKLLDPTIEIIADEEFDLEPESKGNVLKIGSHLLRVTTLLMPYVDPISLRPIVELRQQAPTEQQANETLVIRGLRAGGHAIENYFGSAMTDGLTR